VPFAAGQTAHEVEPAAADEVPAAQLMQVVDLAADEYFPAAQMTHWVPPVTSL